MDTLRVGDTAPDIELNSHLDSLWCLAEARGMNVVIAFFPLAWTPV